MTAIILKERIGDVRNYILYYVLLIINTMVIYIMYSAGSAIHSVYESDWFKENADKAYSYDIYYLKKFKIFELIGNYFIIICIIVLAIITAYVIIQHIGKKREGKALLHTLGYNSRAMFKYMVIESGVDTLFTSSISILLSILLLKLGVLRLVFGKILDLSGAELSLEGWLYALCPAAIYIFTLLTEWHTYKRAKKTGLKLSTGE